MTEAPTNRGLLTDKEGTGFRGCRILVDGEQADRAFTVLDFVQKYLDAIPKKARVCFTTQDQKISKIWEDKPAPAKQEEKKDNCTSSGPPANVGLKEVEGQIIEIDKPAHKITLKDKAGARHTFIWGPALDTDFTKLNQWWFCKVTGEHEPDVDLWRATAQGFFKKPEDWPVSQHGGGGGRPFQPRNEKLIVLQSTLKACADVFAITTTPDTLDFDAAMDLIIARAIKDTETLMKAGVQCTAGKVA
jgi:hypothetical protein